jgi:2-polyprenyl-3-methyl-5-hydroxy-6-metoxy-1,4-benzoquinol methylase
MKPHDNSARFYDCIYQRRFGEGLNQLTQANLRQIQQLVPGGKILDFGAGTGRLSIPLAKLGYEVEAIDISQAMLDVLIEKAARENLIIQTAQDIVNTDWSKDMVIAVFTVFAYILEDLEMESTLKLIYDSLKPGGYFMFDLVKKKNINIYA